MALKTWMDFFDLIFVKYVFLTSNHKNENTPAKPG